MHNLRFLSTDTMIIVYWSKLFEEKKVDHYELAIDGVKVSNTVKTHGKFEKLLPNTKYEITMTINYNDGDSISEKIVCFTKQKTTITDIVKEYKVIGDGKTLNTQEIQKAIDRLENNATLYFPKGIYLTGALKLHSNMNLYLEKGAILQGTSDIVDYSPKILSRFEGYEMECYQSLLNLGELNHNDGYNCENIIIYGEGEIYGGGEILAKNIARSEAHRLEEYIKGLGDKIKEYEKPETIASRARGRLINMSNCQNIWIHGLKLGKAPSWNVHFIYSDKIYTDDCEFYSQGIWNGDGWDPDSSTNCCIFNCRFYTEDDSVAIKSGKNPEGNEINRPTKNIEIFDCVTHFGHGICMGSEMSGGIENIKIWDCEVGPTWSGIEIKATKKRGGYVRNIEVQNVVASHIQVHSVSYNDDGIGAKNPPKFENCKFSNMHLLGRFLDNNAGKNEWHECKAIDIQGFDIQGYEAENMTFSHIEFEGKKTDIMDNISMNYCKNITFNNLTEL